MSEQLKSEIVSPEAAAFLISLHEKFDNLRQNLLIQRRTQAERFAEGHRPDFLPHTEEIRRSEWQVAEAPHDLRDRRVEITGPAEPKMMINALNSGARVFMADLEDSLSPSWTNILTAQKALQHAVRRTLVHSAEDKIYKLNEKTATLVVRPRGLHLDEKNFLIRGEPISASLFDFGLYFFHNATELLRRGTGPYFYLPKLENHEEAAWWNDVFNFAQDRLQIPRGTIRATVLIETITAAFEMEEILYALKDHAAGLNAGRWDYIFSLIKKFHAHEEFLTPDRSSITMSTPFMDAYCRLLVQTCHRRQAHAIGGMAAFIPNRRDPELTQNAFKKVAEDKKREARIGFDGTWVAHPDLIPVAEEELTRVLKDNPHQMHAMPPIAIRSEDLLNLPSAKNQITEQGVRTNINISLMYIDRWLTGTGAAALHNMMEDVATAEISRSQLWQWLHHRVHLSNGRVFTPEYYRELLQEEVIKLIPHRLPCLDEAVELLNSLVLSKQFHEFMTISAYEILNQTYLKGAAHDFKQGPSVSPA
ncbi:malate synthase A [Bdellovibrio sp. 22V]|uniref:malate synthase A n=1 Tax=Bdellovibrio sp. 22V TaxID=3044166 RepID=UPI002542CA58|nr:malate synthase A [Bdellovibrio sp. 22V]WII73874.1 malate synthase A [Bdellovibrio sp. 22V]